MTVCLIGFGSNLGDRRENLQRAAAELRATPGVEEVVLSRFHDTQPVGGPPGQGDFLNAVARVTTRLSPQALLEVLLAVETRLGRTREIHWGPRSIDLDLLLYGDEVVESPRLTVPHPRLATRKFVLEPACEVAADLRHPLLGRTMGELLNQLLSGKAAPILLRTRTAMRAAMAELRRTGRTAGLVPTMGALHAGHVSLVEAARNSCDAVIATIFVNPTQFAPHEDFQRYPRTLAADLEKLSQAGADFVFAPSSDEVYRAGHSTYLEPPAVSLPLEGQFRPGHFRGVATVVLKLFHMIPADVAFFGQKDYQQSLVIRRMADDLDLPLRIDVCPTVREPDGLAMSSRNAYLSAAERQQALAVSQSLWAARDAVAAGERSSAKVKCEMERVLRAAGIERIDYVALADPETLEERETLTLPVVALVAAFAGKTRLIDNWVID